MVYLGSMQRNVELEATIVAKYAAVSPVLDERSRRRWAAAESVAIGYGGDALVSSATGLARETIRKGRREITQGGTPTGRIRRPGAGRPRLEQRQPGLLAALEGLVDPLTRGDPTSPLRWQSRWSATGFMGNGITNCYPDEVGKFISITVLSVSRCPLVGGPARGAAPQTVRRPRGGLTHTLIRSMSSTVMSSAVRS